MNITWYSALNREDGTEDTDLQVSRFVASRSIALVLAGVPGIYLPSLIGGRNDLEAVARGEEARSINRERIHEEALLELLSDPSTSAYKIARRFEHLIEKRIECRAFHPNGRQRVFPLNPAVFTLLREAPDASLRVLCLVNVTAFRQVVTLPATDPDLHAKSWFDMLSDFGVFAVDSRVELSLEPYQIMWLKAR